MTDQDITHSIEAIRSAVEALEAAVSQPEPSDGGPTFDSETFLLHFDGAVADLGSTQRMRLFHKLASRPWVNSYETLMCDVWLDTLTSRSTVRSGVDDLRVTLCKGGLSKLADAIKTVPGGWKMSPIWLSGISSPPSEKPANGCVILKVSPPMSVAKLV